MELSLYTIMKVDCGRNEWKARESCSSASGPPDGLYMLDPSTNTLCGEFSAVVTAEDVTRSRCNSSWDDTNHHTARAVTINAVVDFNDSMLQAPVAVD
mmetsp:Transcript_475/g.1113  ORF Transcript_475/g.1113 Transcript_475/m.1113 type:complete len:98 (-) Transcript_475:69-362(-)